MRASFWYLGLIIVTSCSLSGAIAVDATKFVDRSTSSTTLTSPALSTAAGNELLLALVSTDYKSGSPTTVTGVTGAGLTWALVARTNAQSGTAEIWRAFAPSTLASVTVVATLSQSVPASMTVMSFSGVDTSGTNGSGAIGAIGTGNAASGAPKASLTTTRIGSVVIGVGNDWDKAIARTVPATQTLVHQYLATVGDTYWVQTLNAATTAIGSIATINDTGPTTDRYNLSIAEILPAAIANPVSDLTISKSHSGSFVQGQTGATYTISVSNTGTAATVGTVTVTDTLPAGLTGTAISGSGWTCSTPPTLNCTRSDGLSAGASYPALTLTVNVASNAPGSVINTAAVSGGGETNTANNSAADATSVLGPPDLTVSKSHTGNFVQGQNGATYTITVSNSGGTATTGTVTMTDTLPAGLTATAISGSGWTCSPPPTLTCTRGTALAAGTSYPAITLTVNVAANAPASVTNSVAVAGGGETNAANDSATDVTTIGGPSDLTVIKAHTGSFVQGQNGAIYTISASNAGGAATSGTVTITDTLPAGLTATAISGTGWTCSAPPTLNCTRSDALSGGASYPSVTLTVNVASNAPASVTNNVTVSGGGEINAANDTSNDVTTITPLSVTGIKSIQSNVNGNESGTASMSVSFLANNTQGHFLIVTGTAARPASTLTISDTLGNTYTPAFGPFTDTTQDVTGYIWYVPICKGGTNTVTITPSTTAALEIHVSEWSGVASVSSLDQSGSATGSGTNVSSPTVNPSMDGELIFGYSWVFNNASAGAGFTPLTLVNGDLTEYQIQTSAAQVAATFTQTAGAWFAAILTFRPAGIWNISGSITPANTGAGATLNLTGASNAVTVADSSGNYSFSGIANGNYTVTPSKSGFIFSPTNLPVVVNNANQTAANFTVGVQAPPILSVAPASLVFTGSQGGPNPAASTISVANSGGGTFNFSAASDSPAWLAVSPASGTSPLTLQVSTVTAGLAIGTYTGHITVTAAGVQGSPETVTVTLYIGALGDWLTSNHDPSRSGYAFDETTINTSDVGNLQLAWSAPVDASVTAQPLYVHSISVAGQTRDVLVVGTGANSIYAFDANTGAVLWQRNFGAADLGTFGLPDGFGIEAPPVIDRITGRIYTVATDGSFHAISLFDGTDVFPALALVTNPLTNKVWGGLNKVGNSVYVAIGSNGGDVPPWAGKVYQVDVSSTPSLVGTFVVVPSIQNGGGGIWGSGGVSADLATGMIFASTSFDSKVNGQGNEGYTPYADSMVALTPQLGLLGYYQPPQPSSFPCGGIPCDLDFASTPTFFKPTGCPLMVAAGNKNGNLYLFRVSDLMVSGQPWQILPLNNPYDSIGLGGVAGVPAFSPVTNMLYIGDAGNGVSGVVAGLVAISFNSGCTMQMAWSKQLASAADVPNSSPTIANGVVFIGEGLTGIIHAYDAQTGNPLWQSGAQYHAASTFAAPIVANGKVFAGSWTSFGGGGIVGAFSVNAAGPTLSVSPASLNFSATTGGSNPAPATISIANSGSGSLSYTASSDGAWLTISPSAGSAPASPQVSASIAGLVAGTYTGHITVTSSGALGSPAVVTVTLTVGSSGGGGTLAIDANVSKDNGSGSTTVVSPPFSKAFANQLLLAFVATDSLSSNITVTGVTGAGLTWALVQRTNSRGGTSEIWRAFAATTLSNVSVTATLSQSVASSMTVMSFSGVDTSGTNGSGAIGAIGTANSASGSPSASLTSTRNNSWVLGVGNDYDNAIDRTVGPNQTLVHQYKPPVGDTYWVQRQNAATPSSGTLVTLNDTAPSTDQYNLSIVEVIPHP